jgi:hypothetical protein
LADSYLGLASTYEFKNGQGECGSKIFNELLTLRREGKIYSDSVNLVHSAALYDSGFSAFSACKSCAYSMRYKDYYTQYFQTVLYCYFVTLGKDRLNVLTKMKTMIASGNVNNWYQELYGSVLEYDKSIQK